jgi:hypothetical protein
VSKSESDSKQSLFREKAFLRLSSPEQLDQRIEVVSPTGWIALIALIVLALAILVWSIFGEISEKITGDGIVAYDNRGIIGVSSRGSGQINGISVREGDHVNAGDILANISQDEIVNEIAQLQGRPGSGDYLKTLQEELETASVIRAPVSGAILDINYSPYSYIEQGGLLCRIVEDADASEDILVILYVPLLSGKTIEAGMPVAVSPEVSNKEEDGYLVGKVKSVSRYAVSTESMMTVLDSQQLVDSLSAQGAMLEVQVELVRDETAPSGYLWSRAINTPDEVAVEVLCQGDIQVSGYRPITLLLPFLEPLLP